MRNGFETGFVLARNLRSAWRQYLREPLMSSIAILSLAIALGAGACLYGFVNLMLFTAPPGLPGADRLVNVGRTTQGHGFDTLSWPNYEELAAQAKSFDALYAYTSMPASLHEKGSPARTQLALVSGNYFDALRIVPQAGRLLQPADGDDKVVVASHDAFMEHLGGDPGRMGESVEINGTMLTLVGVLPPTFNGTDITGSADFYAPIRMAPQLGRLDAQVFDTRRSNWLLAGGRLADGVTLEQANAELAALSRELREIFPDANRGIGHAATPLRMLPAPARLPLMVFAGLLFGLIAMVLLVAAGNFAGLLVARGEARRHEIAMRHVLGARRGTVVAQLLTEVLALSLVAAGFGLLIALWLRTLVAGLDLPIPIAIDLAAPFDLRVFGFLFALSLFVTLLAGLAPALRVSAQQPRVVLSGTGGQAGTRNRFRAVMVSAQVAFTLLLMVLAGLFIAALQRAGDVELGYDIQDMHVAEIDMRASHYDASTRRRVTTGIIQRLEQQGRVQEAAAARVVPLYFHRLGYGGFLLDDGESLGADANIVSPGFFDALRIPVRGRAFTAGDIAGGERVAIVNQVLADLLAPDGDVIGQSFRFGDPEDPWLLRVIGVTPDARYSRLDDTHIPFLYLPLSQVDEDTLSIFVRSDAGSREIARMIGEAVRAADPRLAMPEVESMDDILALSLLPQRMAGSVAGVLGALGMLLAALGLYGLLAAHVFSRTRELGVRLALGARPAKLMRAVLWRGLRLVFAGVAAGLFLGVLLARALDGYLFGLQAFDVMVFLLATALMLGIGVAALLVPARQVLGIEPQEALRHE